MKVLFGLGNPGSKYEKTRHNVGFMFLDYLAKEHGVSFVSKPKLKAEIAEFISGGQKILLVKPTTFMNLSGDCVRLVFDFYKVSLMDLCVVFDDIDLSFGQIRYRNKGGAGTHNGMRDIVLKLSSKDFARMKLGIEIENRPHDLSNFVLSKFSPDEFDSLVSIFSETKTELLNNFLDFS